MPRLTTDITGQIFGHLTALRIVGKQHRASVWQCGCSCGNVVNVKLGNLRTSNTRSCGCGGVKGKE